MLAEENVIRHGTKISARPGYTALCTLINHSADLPDISCSETNTEPGGHVHGRIPEVSEFSHVRSTRDQQLDAERYKQSMSPSTFQSRRGGPWNERGNVGG